MSHSHSDPRKVKSVPSPTSRSQKRTYLLVLVSLVLLLGILISSRSSVEEAVSSRVIRQEQETLPVSETAEPAATSPVVSEQEEQVPAAEPTPAVEEDIPLSFQPHCVPETDPANLMVYTEVMVNGESIGKLDYTVQETAEPETSSLNGYNYTSPYGEISFGDGDAYTDVAGIVTFRGDNYRSGSAYGTTQALTSKTLSSLWSVSTGSLTDYNGNVWTGSGWTGQPLVVRWPKETRQLMTSMYESARNKEDLVEVIYATMDGYIYFLDLEDGSATRKPLYMGLTYKGAGALDPRGYPILYVGSGVRNMDGQSHVSVVNLLDCSVMYTFGDKDKFALRDWPMFDSSPLVDAETDQLIYPGENGILYIIHLNTQYDPAAGTLSIDPDNVVKWRYQSTRQTRYVYWLGMESSAAALEGCLIMCDNGGNLMCLDLNTLQLVWVKDILDDSNDTPLISIENGKAYIYVSTSFHDGWRGTGSATIPVWKIDAETGETVWQTDFTCWTQSGVAGGVQGTMAIDDTCLYVPVAKTDDKNGGTLVCLDRETGEIRWEFATSIYSWGSPIRFNDTAGGKYLIYNTGYSSSGTIYLLNAETGERLSYLSISGNIEASGVVFENKLVIGHRSCRILGIGLS